MGYRLRSILSLLEDGFISKQEAIDMAREEQTADRKEQLRLATLTDEQWWIELENYSKEL